MSPSLRVKFFLTGALFPLCCVVTAIIDSPTFGDSPWQSGRIYDFALLFLHWPTIGAYAPAMACSAACLTVWTVRPSTSRHLTVRWGVYTGIPVALFYFVVILLTTGLTSMIAALFLGPLLAGIVFACNAIASRATRFTIRHLMIFTMGCAVVAALTKSLGTAGVLLEFLAALGFWMLAATPTLNLVTYARAAAMIYREAREQPSTSVWKRIVGWLAFFLAHGGSTRLALTLLLEEYAKLPTTDPNCYLSGAALHRHAWFFPVEENAGVSLQTKRLKFLELAFRARIPTWHRCIRKYYDQYGPPMARACSANRWLADATYLAITPMEWLAESLRDALGIPAAQIQGLYSMPVREPGAKRFDLDLCAKKKGLRRDALR